MMKQVIFVAMIVAMVAFTNAQEDEVIENVGLEGCRCIGTFEHLPLCANNGVTYSNPSMLKCAQRCLAKNDLVKVKDGRC